MGFRKTSDSYTVNSCVEKGVPIGVTYGKPKKSGQEYLSSSLSTTYASSSSSSSASSSASSTSSDDEMNGTTRRYSHCCSETEMDTKIDSQTSAVVNVGFVLSEEDVANNNIKINQQSIVESNTTTTTASPIKTPDNCFLSLYVNGKECNIMVNVTHLFYEPELTTATNINGKFWGGKILETFLEIF